MDALRESITYLSEFKADTPDVSKSDLQNVFLERFRPDKVRSVFKSKGFALRFSEAQTGSFSNTVLSLSALKAYDDLPFVVVVNRPDRVDFLLSNSTFLKKISHSSLQLRVDNVRGSFNGSDIMVEFDGMPNEPANIEKLFALHSAFTWHENLERLVEATNQIVAKNVRYSPGEEAQKIILQAPERALAALDHADFLAAENELRELVNSKKDEIFEASKVDNVNLRGNAIEQLLTQAENAHELGDIERSLGDGRLVIDIKTKLLDKASAPKAYNVDKMLAFLAEPGSVLAFFMVGVDQEANRISTKLLPVLERSLVDATSVQHHWAGRGTRGVTQLSGPYAAASEEAHKPKVDLNTARDFLTSLIAL